MSKEELLKYLIAEIDLIMHDKDYRFENANGTWYSRESCRDLTNEEVFEELRTELRQFADLEAKLAECEEEHELLIDQFEEETEKLRKQIKQESDARKRFVEEVKNLKQQLAEKEKEIQRTHNYYQAVRNRETIRESKISFCIEQLEKVKGLIANHTQELWTCENDDIAVVLYEEIDKQINGLKGKVE